jgi:hypothetical protein
MGARYIVGRGLSDRPARLHKLTELIPLNRFLGSLKVSKYLAGRYDNPIRNLIAPVLEF